ncbi:MAG: hypothetical protein EXX96DRAFT_482058 [Benjaminiella poitrasii]|nr:MAG: hypothetical protein EXX96DRAFT_482058 [Benjaminiella poitrasii]
MSNLFAFIRPDVSIQVKEEHPRFSQSVESIAQEYNATSISLPLNDIKHALWISDLSIAALKHWNDIKMDLVVITDRRPRSLARLLESANNATYLGDKVELVVNMEQTADHKTHNLVNRFQFNHGLKKLRHRIRKGGLMPAIVESWYPSDNDNYGVLLEDDIELSPLFYVWSKYNILKYRYEENNDSDAYKYVYGVSLYSPRNLELLPEGRRPFNPEPVLEEGGYSKRAPYATQIPCSWGAVYFPEHWREFHAYLTERINKEERFGKGFYNITVPESRSERWKKSWKKYFIELVYLRAYVMVYPNFEHFQSFSTNHLEYGTHVKESKQGRAQSKLEQFLVPLMQNDNILAQLPDARLPRFDELPKMDLWGRLRTLDALDQVGAQWHQEVSTCQREQIGAFDPSDLLCPFETNVLKSKNKRSQY